MERSFVLDLVVQIGKLRYSSGLCFCAGPGCNPRVFCLDDPRPSLFWIRSFAVLPFLLLCLVRVGSEYTPSIPILSQYVEEYQSSTIVSRILR